MIKMTLPPASRVRHAAALLSVLAFSLLAGCARPPADSRTTPPPDAEPPPVVTYPASDYQEAAPGLDGGVLRVSTTLDPTTLDAHLLADTITKWLGRTIFDCLVYLDNEGNPTPWLAESWTISPDGKTYVFKLRRGVTFSDGTPFDAEAVRVNLKRIRDPHTRTRMTTAYIAPYVDGVVLDSHTFQANLREPYSAFLNVLSQSWFGMISPKQILEAPETIATNPVATGPFVVERYRRQQSIHLVKRPDYAWSPPFQNRRIGPAYLDRIEIEIVSEALLRYASLTAGKHDLTTEAPPPNAAAIRRNSRLVLESRVNLGNPVRNPTFNVNRPPFDDPKVRQAIARGIDREGIARIVGFGEYITKTDYLSANTRHYDPAHRAALLFNPEEADRLLNEAGWNGRDAEGYRTKDGARLVAEMLTNEASAPGASTVALRGDLRRLGIELRIVPLPQPQLVERRAAGDFNLSGGGYWHTNTPDGLYIVYHGAQLSQNYRGQNTSGLDDPELNELLTRARHVSDQGEQRDLYSRAQARLVEIVPAIPLYENHTLIAYGRHVRGVVHDTSHNVPFLACVWLDDEARRHPAQ